MGSDSIEEKIDFFLDKDKLWKWEPSHLNTRIVVQQSVFVFGTGTIDDTHYEFIQLMGTAKGKFERYYKRDSVSRNSICSAISLGCSLAWAR